MNVRTADMTWKSRTHIEQDAQLAGNAPKYLANKQRLEHSRMKKSVLAVLLVVVLVLSLVGCNQSGCKRCGDPVYKSGYCKDHYISASMGWGI